jgi:hypothetical protein
MSDSISTPSNTPAPSPAVIPGGSDSGPSSPPASGQPSISISDAARLLNQQRRQGQPPPTQPPVQRAEAQPRPQPRPPSPPAVPGATPAAAPATPTPAPTARDDALDTMAKALGLPEGVPGAASPPADPMAPGFELDGRRVSADEVRRAFAAATDYTQKTQALARERQQLQQQQEALATVLPYIQPELERVQQQITSVARPDPTLIDSNPQEYLRQRAAYEAAYDEQGRLAQLTQLQQQAQERALAAQVAASNEALAKQFPDWGDPAKRSVWQQRIAAWAEQTAGFQRQELMRLSDHRQLTVMMKAMLWDHMKNGAVTAAPRQQAPVRGTRPPPAPAAAIQDAEQAFTEKATMRNATALLTARRNSR